MKIIHPYCLSSGGNVIMGQLENEYGSYGNDKKYLSRLHKVIRDAGFEEKLVTSDGTSSSMLEFGSLQNEGVLPTVNFGSNAKYHFDYLQDFSDKDIPLMCMEFWCGWFSSWKSEEIIKTSPKVVAMELDEILKRGSVNFYMFHGGTNFGMQGGANRSDERGYTPDTTSYDYDALLDERGNITQKYIECKKIISKYVDVIDKEFDYIPSTAYTDVTYEGSYEILDGKEFDTCNSPYPLTMEELGYGYGYILYKSKLLDIDSISQIDLQGMCDRALVYINNEKVAELFDDKNSVIELDVKIAQGSEISILVENTGRVNYGKYMDKQQKGIHGGVFINKHAYLFDWEMTKVHLEYENIRNLPYVYPKSDLPQIHKYTLNISQNEILDTYIETTDCGKGYIFVNGFNVGRFWDVGPQYKIYVPGQLLNHGENEILILETEGKFNSLKFSD